MHTTALYPTTKTAAKACCCSLNTKFPRGAHCFMAYRKDRGKPSLLHSNSFGCVSLLTICFFTYIFIKVSKGLWERMLRNFRGKKKRKLKTPLGSGLLLAVPTPPGPVPWHQTLRVLVPGPTRCAASQRWALARIKSRFISSDGCFNEAMKRKDSSNATELN